MIMSLVVSGNAVSNMASAAKNKVPSLSTKKITIKVGGSKKLSIKNKPAKSTVKWSIKNKKIATVSNGKIKGIKAGKTTVVCKLTYTKNKKRTTKNLSAAVVVNAKKDQNTAVSGEDSNLTKEHKSQNGIKTKDNGMMRKELSSLDLINKYMGPGWNLGNQMEQSNWQGDWKTITECETSAGNPVATQKTFDGLKSYGINTVRVPVAWSNFISKDGKYTINEELFNRVEEIINYALNDEMYVIINIHWDGGWWGRFGAEPLDAAETPIRDEAWKKYEAIWTQIANRYKEYSDHLIFEGANEELSGRLNDDYNHPEKGQSNQTGVLPKDGDDIYKLVNQINQKFVDIVRKSGGNNKYRHLLIPGTGNESCVIGGYAGDTYKTDGTMDARYKMPTDLDENGVSKLSVSVHYYDPTDYGISATSTTSWGYRDSWGTPEDYTYMENLMGRLKAFTDKGYGVIIGECGCVKGYKDNVIDYLTALYKNAKEIGCCAVLWDEGHYYERSKGYFAYGDVGEFFANLTNSKPDIPKDAKLVNTGISVVPTVENQNPKVVYTWNGEFMRHTGDSEAEIIKKERGDVFDPVLHGIGYTTSVTDAAGNDTDELKVEVNSAFWNVHFTTDWSKLKEPCIRVYPMDNEVSKSSDLQLGYMEKSDSVVRFDVDYDQNAGTWWVGKYIKLDTENLKDYPWIWVTTNTYTGCSYVKIEVCDGAYNADGSEFVSNTK